MTHAHNLIDLAPGQVRRLRLDAGELLLVRAGRVWLTREGDPIDHILEPGRGHVAAFSQELVIESCAPAGSLCERQPLPRVCGFSPGWLKWLPSGKRVVGR